jgi:hypothetical protein
VQRVSLSAASAAGVSFLHDRTRRSRRHRPQALELKIEHRDLDLAIERLSGDAVADELTVKRLKNASCG